MEENVIRPSKGLHQDNSPQDQPKDTYRFALNSVSETELGDFAFLGNEESNEPCDALPDNFIPIGKVYLGEGQTIIFSVSKDETVSEIGILNDGCVYETHVNDEFSLPGNKLNFKVTKQIQAQYRLRRGCERTVYFTDDHNKPRYYNFDKPEDFQTSGEWIGTKFNLFKQYNSIPIFTNIEVLNSGGVLTPGSYNIAVQYVDEGLNSTEWMAVSDILNVYNDRTTEAFLDIQGSLNNEGTDYEDFPNTTKAIKVTLGDLDSSFAFYRLAFIEATSGSGFVSAVKFTEIIPTSKNFFIYTGQNITTQGAVEEIAFFNETIYRAKTIEQIENRLLLGNTQGKQVDFCKLQKYASRIKADCITKKVLLNDITDLANPKNPVVRTQATGYMPGELYSFAIVYIFADGSISPAYHIPGKNNSVIDGTIYTTGDNVYPMEEDNTSLNNRYIDNESCGSGDYWGLDSEGAPLKNQLVRHHRFPKRSQIGKNLVDLEASNASEFIYYRLQIDYTGTITLPVVCPDPPGACVAVVAPPFGVNIYYTVDGQAESFTLIIDPADYASNPITDFTLSPYYTTNAIVVTKIEEEQTDGTVDDTIDITGVIASPRGLNYSTTIIDSTITLQNDLYSTEILGIKFSGVDIPDLADTNDEQITGYYIVRNERTENEKTILDSAVLFPTIVNSKYVSHGLLTPDTTASRYSKSVYAMLHPEHKFNNIQYDEFDEIEQEGNFDITSKSYSKTRYNDVMDGSSFDGEHQKDGNDDGRTMDGWGLAIIIRDAYTRFVRKKTFSILRNKIKEIFYLKALESRDLNDGAVTAYNVAADNRIGMLQMNQDSLINTAQNELPYVLLKRFIADSYSNFRLLPYYKDTDNPEPITNSEAEVFGGDSYVSPMRYVNTVFWDNRIAQRKGKTSVLNYIIGAVLIVVGTLLLIFSGGFSSTLIIVGAGIAVAGAGITFIASGISKDAWNKAYNEEWRKGLRETALDTWVSRYYQDNSSDFGIVGSPYTTNGPSDDEIQWIGDCVTDLWFESKVNIQLRNKMTSDVPCFLDAPGVKETGNNQPLIGWEFFSLWYEDAKSRYPISKLDHHFNKKLLVYNSKRKDNREYVGIPMGEYYKVSADFNRINSQKIYYHLPLEYDCCSDCKEDFPHRVHYSEQSFQEELTDNYRVFLPNNYRDIDGETGEITNIFKIGNNLFLHTREALWQMPRNYQERITDQIISFIGTGSFFEIPPQKVVDDDNGSSAGLQHQWSTIKTPYGYMFVSENQRKVYLFNGKDLKALSNIGLSNYFKENTRLDINEQYYASQGRNYKYDDNPSNPFGSGFISTYDTKKERLILTKKDFKLSDSVLDNPDFEICIQNGQVILFENFQATINAQAALGWNYIGLEDCKMKFEKTSIQTVQETRNIKTVVNNEADIIIWLDTSGSFDAGARNQIKSAVNTWLVDFATQNPDWSGTLHYLELPASPSEEWVKCLEVAKSAIYAGSLAGKDIVMVTFVNEAQPAYHGLWSGASIASPTGTYNTDVANLMSLYSECKSFIGLAYPIVFPGNSPTQEYLKHVLAAVKGVAYTLAEFNILEVNPFFNPAGGWSTLKSALMGSNPYPNVGLDQYGWSVITNRGWSGSGSVITSDQFQEDMNEFLEGVNVTEEVIVNINQQVTEQEFIEGTVVENPLELNSSWTMSFSLKLDTWTSWHSYMPEFYINTPEKFYSWKYGSNNIWKHNKKNLFQTYYGEFNPHIIEYVSLSNPLVTRIWNHIRLNTEARLYDLQTEQYNEERFITHNKLIVYNTRQCTGLLELLVKDIQLNSENYFSQQIMNYNNNTIIIDRTERDWYVNDLRDIRIDYTKPIWNSNITSLQPGYFIDKILNTVTLDTEKDWTQLESFKDKYLVIRLIFDNFANVKLITNYSVENEQQSFI